MSLHQPTEGSQPSSWRRVNGRMLDVLLALTVLIGAASLLAMASGEPELVALVALTGLAVVFLGTFLVRRSEQLRTGRGFDR